MSYGDGLTAYIGAAAVAPPTTVQIAPEADSYVQSAAPNTNYGTLTYFGTGVTQYPNYVRSFHRFNLTTIPPGKTILSAYLYIYVYSIWGTYPYSRKFDLHFVPTDTWGETTITYNNQPGIGACLIYNTQIATVGWYGYDITSQVKAEYAGDGKISLRWRDNPESAAYYEGWYAYSKEYSDATKRQYLEVTYQ